MAFIKQTSSVNSNTFNSSNELDSFDARGRPKFSIASLSLGTNLYHDLPTKIRVASELGYDGIEIFMPDFEVFVDEVRQGKHTEFFSSPPPDPMEKESYELACADALQRLCSFYNLEISLLQPFRNFENFRSQSELDVALDEAERWFRIMNALNCEYILVCSNFVPPPYPLSDGYTLQMYLDAQVDAFTQLSDRAEKYDVKIGYEPLSWGTVVDNWMQIWDVVKRVDRDNVGVILDSFNTLGNQYADPGEISCLRHKMTLQSMLENLDEMARTIPGDKIFCYQIADGVRPPHVLEDSSDMPRRMKWSRTSRVFPCEPPSKDENPSFSYDPENPPTEYLGFLPVTEMSALVHKTGFRGWWSLEVYNSSLHVSDESCPWRHGRRGIDGLRTLWDVVKEMEMDQGSYGKKNFKLHVADSEVDDLFVVGSPSEAMPQLSSSPSEASNSDVDIAIPLPVTSIVPSVDTSSFKTGEKEMRIEVAADVSVNLVAA